MERWALQLVHYFGSRTAQISVVQYQFYMESRCSTSIESVNRLLHSILQLPGSLQLVLASPDTEIAPQISQSRKFPPALFSIKIWSDQAIKTASRSVRCPLQDIRTSAESAYSFMERWALQLAEYRGSGMDRNPSCSPNYRPNLSVPSP